MRADLFLPLASLGGLSFAAGTGTADAEPARVAPAAAVAPRETEPNLFNLLYELADTFNVSSCAPGALPLIPQLPPLPSGLINDDLLTQALSQTTLALSAVCTFSVTGAVGDVYTSYLPTWYSWYRAHSSTIQKIITACPSATSLVHTVEDYESCPQVPRTSSEPTMTTTTTTGDTLQSATDAAQSGSPTPPDTAAMTSVPPTGAAPRETGVGIAAAAAAGFMGAVAVL
ncbi:hypothetical protein F4780DRAFT_3175 [Xylariomycetidae sp. FL0641]|nr:hypothetical protein F4780DRAFT_3175 [Xylariomycetidae sp. FL0641]